MVRASKIAVLLLKLAVSLTLIALLIDRIGGRTILDNIRMSSPLSFLGAMACYFFASFLSTLRWRLLVPRKSGIGRFFRMYMIGVFFNTYLPGIVGGDAVKAYYLSRDLQIRRDASESASLPLKDGSAASDLSNHENIVSIASVFMDRYIGMSALLLISIAALPFCLPYIENHALKWPVFLAIAAASAAYVISAVIIFRFRLGERFAVLRRLYVYFHFYRTKRDLLAKAFAYSVGIQFMSITAVYLLSRGLSLNIPFLSLVVFVPLIIMVSFLPISISGLGIREGAFVVLLGILGVAADLSVTLSLLWFLSVVAVSLWGFFEYLRFRAAQGAPLVDA